MTRAGAVKLAWLALVMAGISATAVLMPEAHAARRVNTTAAQRTAYVPLVTMADGTRGMADSGGYVTPLRSYQHIAAGSTVADELLVELAEPARIIAHTKYGATHNLYAHKLSGRLTVGGAPDLEVWRRHRVELLVTNHIGSPADLARARDAGIEVFNLGEMRGLRTLIPNIHALAQLLGAPARGERLAKSFLRRMRAVAADIPPAKRKRAAYVSAYGSQLFGGADGSSYHDVIVAAGLIDAAAARYHDYPQYDPEQLLQMNPEIVVTQKSSVQAFCRISQLAVLEACRNGRRGIIGMDDELLSNPGLGMLDAAEELRELVYGPQR